MNNLIQILVFAVSTLVVGTAQAAWPQKPVRIIIPYSAGGTSDIVARTLQPHLSKTLNQPVVIELIPGANGSIGASRVVATSDNYTFLLTADEIVPNSIMEPLSGHSLVNFRPVTFMAHSPVTLGVRINSPYKTTADLLNADQITFGNGGTRSIAYFTTSAARPNWTGVPYKGGGQMWPDVIAGHVDASAASALQTSGHVQGNKIRPMLVFSRNRLATMPDVPTSYEMGIPISGSVWLGILAPNNTTDQAVSVLSRALITALNDPAIAQPLIDRGLVVEPKGPQEFSKYLQESTTSIKKLIKE
jgi:tripartite-type tricarboxylate transporter receptor subunit TctC